MAYSDEADITAEVGAQNIIPFLDDDGDGLADTGLLANIISLSDSYINGKLASIYTVPISPTPPFLRYCSLILSCERLYRRRMAPTEKNPYTSEADQIREQLTEIGNGELPLDLNVPREFTQGVANVRGTIYGAAGTNNPFNTM